MVRRRKRSTPNLYNIFHYHNLKEFETEHESVISVLTTLEENNLSPRVQGFFNTEYACELVKGYDHICFLKVNGKGELYRCERLKTGWTLDIAIEEGKWNKITESELIDKI